MFKTHTSVHKALARLAGDWEGTVRTWFEPGKLGDEQPVRGTMKPVLDGRFMLHEYETTLSGEPCQGMAIYGYDSGSRRFQAAWIDSCHMDTAIMFSESDPAMDGDRVGVVGGYRVPGHPDWGWRTEIEILDDDTVVITAFNISPQGEEAKAVETRYRRIK